MTPADQAWYDRIMAAKRARQAHVDTVAGWTAAPVRLWHFDTHTGDADPTGARLATDTRTRIRGRR